MLEVDCLVICATLGVVSYIRSVMR